MYTFEPPILYPEDALRGAYFLRSAPKKFSLIVLHARCMVPLGLFLVAFPPPPVTFPATRLGNCSEEHASGVALIWLIISKERCSFLSEQLMSPCGVISKPFGFGSRRFRRRLSAPSVRELRVTASAPPPGAGQNAHKQSRL